MTDTRCPICELPQDILDEIEVVYLEGKSVEDIGIEYSLDFAQVAHHCKNCITTIKSTSERYSKLIKEVADVMEVSRLATTEKPKSPGLQQSYARLVETYRDLIREADDLRQPEDRVKDIISRVINPLLQHLLKDITGEMDLLKTNLIKQGFDIKKTDGIIISSFQRLGKSIQSALAPALANLNSYYDIKVDERDISKDNNKDANSVN